VKEIAIKLMSYNCSFLVLIMKLWTEAKEYAMLARIGCDFVT